MKAVTSNVTDCLGLYFSKAHRVGHPFDDYWAGPGAEKWAATARILLTHHVLSTPSMIESFSAGSGPAAQEEEGPDVQDLRPEEEGACLVLPRAHAPAGGGGHPHRRHPQLPQPQPAPRAPQGTAPSVPAPTHTPTFTNNPAMRSMLHQSHLLQGSTHPPPPPFRACILLTQKELALLLPGYTLKDCTGICCVCYPPLPLPPDMDLIRTISGVHVLRGRVQHVGEV